MRRPQPQTKTQVAMSVKPLLLLCAIAGFWSIPTQSAQSASIPFAAGGGIDEWRPDGDKAIYLRSRGQWYRGELLGTCFGLRTSEDIGFDTESDGSFSQHSSIVVEGKRCPLSSLEKSEEPPKRRGPSNP
jgi:hypothetical protein